MPRIRVPHHWFIKLPPKPELPKIDQERAAQREVLELQLQAETFRTGQISAMLRQTLMGDVADAVRGSRF